MLNEYLYYHESYVENKCPRMISELLPWLKKQKTKQPQTDRDLKSWRRLIFCHIQW